MSINRKTLSETLGGKTRAELLDQPIRIRVGDWAKLASGRLVRPNHGFLENGSSLFSIGDGSCWFAGGYRAVLDPQTGLRVPGNPAGNIVLTPKFQVRSLGEYVCDSGRVVDLRTLVWFEQPIEEAMGNAWNVNVVQHMLSGDQSRGRGHYVNEKLFHYPVLFTAENPLQTYQDMGFVRAFNPIGECFCLDRHHGISKNSNSQLVSKLNGSSAAVTNVGEEIRASKALSTRNLWGDYEYDKMKRVGDKLDKLKRIKDKPPVSYVVAKIEIKDDEEW
jgi:hypothetical protein